MGTLTRSGRLLVGRTQGGGNPGDVWLNGAGVDRRTGIVLTPEHIAADRGTCEHELEILFRETVHHGCDSSQRALPVCLRVLKGLRPPFFVRHGLDVAAGRANKVDETVEGRRLWIDEIVVPADSRPIACHDFER